MAYQRLAYDDQDSALQMRADCAACGDTWPASRPVVDVDAALEPAPSLDFGEFPTDRPKPVITISEATAHLASRLHLHLD